MDKKELLKLDNQLCFPLYAAAMAVTRLYRPLLEPLGLTYTQYITMMYLWENAPCQVTSAASGLMLNTNTLTPVLKKLENKGFITRSRSVDDERVVILDVLPEGWKLRDQCECIPMQLINSINFPIEDAFELKRILNNLIKVTQQKSE